MTQAHAPRGYDASTLPRFHRRTLATQDKAAIDRAVNEATDNTPAQGATAGGDERKLRGIPAIGRGVSGAINGTAPHSLR